MPCHQHQSNPPQCPFTACLASSSYVSARQVSAALLPPQELRAAVIVPAVLWISLEPTESAQVGGTLPLALGPPLFLQTHSLLI